MNFLPLQPFFQFILMIVFCLFYYELFNYHNYYFLLSHLSYFTVSWDPRAHPLNPSNIYLPLFGIASWCFADLFGLIWCVWFIRLQFGSFWEQGSDMRAQLHCQLSSYTTTLVGIRLWVGVPWASSALVVPLPANNKREHGRGEWTRLCAGRPDGSRHTGPAYTRIHTHTYV